MKPLDDVKTSETVSQPPPPFWFVAIAASAGGVAALQRLLAQLPPSLPAAVVVLLHRPKSPESILDKILSKVSGLPVTSIRYGDPIQPGYVYIARPDLHLVIAPNRHFTYTDGARIRGVLSSANPLFESAGRAFTNRTIAVVLTGSGIDATDGVQGVKASGGIVIVQDPATALHPGMPSSAVKTGAVDRVLDLDEIAPAIVAITTGAAAAGAQAV